MYKYLFFIIFFSYLCTTRTFLFAPPPSNSLKREMHAVSEEFGLQPVTTAMAFVYFEKLVLQGRLNKPNRKLVAAACVLLAAKISSDLRKPEVKQLIDVSPPLPSNQSQFSLVSVSLNSSSS